MFHLSILDRIFIFFGFIEQPYFNGKSLVRALVSFLIFFTAVTYLFAYLGSSLWAKLLADPYFGDSNFVNVNFGYPFFLFLLSISIILAYFGITVNIKFNGS